uniref:Uncharacterized protein n=1 Tax=Chrysotila carterae TaxID=13221 RepID=A0A7S4FAR5_CHRCT|mmetsp:Transcript_29663/g.64920  ORF Transcript_29663/g.64920 Transcript_29663/m.64920 type:complete len:140 (+) Transcript_29663:539-958(+)|eukprot:1908542-Pleurochrysis_carterae.AAC.2
MDSAPSPPLPPWLPGKAPPIPGPVFSQAFVAMLGLVAVGTVVLCGQLFFKIRAMQASEFGEDTEMLTASHDPNWLRSVAASRGRAVRRAPQVEMATKSKAKPAKATGKSQKTKAKGGSRDAARAAKTKRRDPDSPLSPV